MNAGRALKPCSTPGCPELVPRGTSRCKACAAAADLARGTAAQRGYKGRGHARFRRAVLRRDPVCVLCGMAVATVADHYPLSRRELAADPAADPDDPKHGRGLCPRCHSRETARHQPGGWDAP